MEMPIFNASYLAVATNLLTARNAVTDHLKVHTNRSPQQLLDVEIALGEVLQNIIRHGFSGGDLNSFFTIGMEMDDGMLKIAVTESSPALKNTDFLDKSHIVSENGGMGLSLIKELTSKYLIKFVNEKNIHTLVFNFR